MEPHPPLPLSPLHPTRLQGQWQISPPPLPQARRQLCSVPSWLPAALILHPAFSMIFHTHLGWHLSLVSNFQWLPMAPRIKSKRLTGFKALHGPPTSWGSPTGPRFFPRSLRHRPSSIFLLPEALRTCCSLCLGCSSCLSSSRFLLTSRLQPHYCSPSLLLTPRPAHSQRSYILLLCPSPRAAAGGQGRAH